MEMNGDDVMMAQTSDNQDESYGDCSKRITGLKMRDGGGLNMLEVV